MNDSDRLNLKRMIGQTDCDDNTEIIRKLRHSSLIYKDLETFNKLRCKSAVNDIDLYKDRCAFLYNNYMDIFNRLVKDELDIAIFKRLLVALRQIEDGEVDQHEGSVTVGTILKELYIDSALKHSNNMPDSQITYIKSKSISWKQFKSLRN